MRTQNVEFGIRSRVPQRQAHQESVHLRLREREHAMEFHRILGRKHHEQFRERMAFTFQRDLPFFHRFQKRTLRSRRCTVNFIRQKHLRKDRPLANFKLARIRLEHGSTRHIGREQVRRKLDTRKVRTNRRSKRFRNSRLACSRHILDEHMAIGKERHHKHFHLVLLAKQNTIQRLYKIFNHTHNIYR